MGRALKEGAMPKSNYDAIVIGAGIAGLTATKRLLENSNFSVANLDRNYSAGSSSTFRNWMGK
jgi:succinate dehydrogenase/fumarate reductase flavoprotein subunit